MKVRILTTPLMQASTATAFRLATKSMSANIFYPKTRLSLPNRDLSLSHKNCCRIWWTVVVLLASPTGDTLSRVVNG